MGELRNDNPRKEAWGDFVERGARPAPRPEPIEPSLAAVLDGKISSAQYYDAVLAEIQRDLGGDPIFFEGMKLVQAAAKSGMEEAELYRKLKEAGVIKDGLHSIAELRILHSLRLGYGSASEVWDGRIARHEQAMETYNNLASRDQEEKEE